MKVRIGWERLTSFFYQNLGNPDFSRFAKSTNLKFEFIVEAGCHDGTDTLLNLSEFSPVTYHAFEPDTQAFRMAKRNLARNSNSVVLYKKGLGDENKKMFLEFYNQPGSGSSQLSNMNELRKGEIVEICRLDDVLGSTKAWGLLWLDVEGFAVPALIGAKKTLENVAVAKIEVQMHNMERNRLTDAPQVIQIMREANLIPVYMPMHPGFFGDIYFFNRSLCPTRFKVRSAIVLRFFIVLHTKIYPWLNKPKSY